MSLTFNRRGFEDAVLHSDDDYEPYGYVSPELAPVVSTWGGVSNETRFGYYEREIEAAVLRELEIYPGC